MDFQLDFFLAKIPVLLRGVQITIQLTFLSLALGSVVGLIAGMARLSRRPLLRLLSSFYVEIIRGTPALVQIIMIVYGLTALIHYNVPEFGGAVFALAINSGAYQGEIFRAGIQSIDKGQMEAARSLGLSHFQAMRYVILPQAFRRIIPPLVNEFAALLKNTSLISVLGIPELTRQGQYIQSATARPFEPMLGVALIYLVMTLPLSQLVSVMEKKLKIS